ncbi:MAG: adhesin [Methanobrevibacter sp.]|uniref:adhesin n=1 Tax=Methanobrevibacter sp. TaxID=66852 RepID=UPI0025FAA63D|nr:adhesin [Methanobrevibacter sp.]MBQ6139635.1 adhesin [Methanobrevibacter sp.]
MKKPGFLNKITIIDILIIICIIGAVGFAIYHMTDDDSTKASATSFDYSTNPKIVETYLDYYKDGKIVTSEIVGTDAKTGEKLELNRRVLWVGEDGNGKVNVLLDDNGKPLLAGFYIDVPNADLLIDSISLETNGDTYNFKDITVSPKEINNLNDLISEIPNGTNCEITTSISIDNFDSVKYQKLLNALNENKKPCIVLRNSQTNTLEINRANKNDLKIASEILGDFNGQTSQIRLRTYN